MAPNENQKKNNSTLYILVAIVIALLGSTVYFASQKSKIEQKIILLTDEKVKMQAELDRLSADLQVATKNVEKLTGEMATKEKEYINKIKLLKAQLAGAEPSKIVRIQKELVKLKNDISKYLLQIAELKKQNKILTIQKDSLQVEVFKETEKAATFEKENVELTGKNKVLAKAAAALKATNITVQTLKIKKSGKEVVVKKAKKTKKVKMDFRIHQNNFASKGAHDVYIQILDAAGNVLEGEAGGTFNIDGKDMAYTNRVSIDFTNEEKDYSVEWTNTQPFVGGDYHAILYSDGYIMGQAKFTLK